MKELHVGDILICSEDEDTWDDLIKVLRKANKAYLESIKDTSIVKKESILKKLKNLF